jgi:hypothetical protein
MHASIYMILVLKLSFPLYPKTGAWQRERERERERERVMHFSWVLIFQVHLLVYFPVANFLNGNLSPKNSEGFFINYNIVVILMQLFFINSREPFFVFSLPLSLSLFSFDATFLV